MSATGTAQNGHSARSAMLGVATDVAIFTVRKDELAVLLLRRNHSPFAGSWALPGGLLADEEAPEAGARRVLAEQTGLAEVYLEQLYTFGQPHRDPRGRVVSVAYFALVPYSRAVVWQQAPVAIAWYAARTPPELAFDHAEIVAMARQRLAAKLEYSTIALQLMPRRFTLSQLQGVYETILGVPLDKRNFRKRLRTLDCLELTDEMDRSGGHRPARLYRRKQADRVQFIR